MRAVFRLMAVAISVALFLSSQSFRFAGKPPSPYCSGPFCSAVAVTRFAPGDGDALGERHLLSIVQTLQQLGDRVDVLVTPEAGWCVTKECTMEAAAAQGMNINFDQFTLIVVFQRGHDIVGTPRYRLFVALDDEFMPPVQSLGEMSIYVNRMPCPPRETTTVKDSKAIQTFASYDAVVFSTHDALKRFEQLAQPSLATARDANLLAPQFMVAHPPVGMAPAMGKVQREHNIVLLASVHDTQARNTLVNVIKAFSTLRNQLPHLKLKVVPGMTHEDYRRHAPTVDVMVEVVQACEASGAEFLFDLSDIDLSQQMRSASFVWAFAGVEEVDGMSTAILESMSAGVIPVLEKGDAMADFANKDATFLFSTIQECMVKTSYILHLPLAKLAACRMRAREHAMRFNLDAFNRKFKAIFQIHEMSFFWRPLALQVNDGPIRLPVRSPYAAAIVETRCSIVFPLVVRMNLKMLQMNGLAWRLYIFYGNSNGEFVKASLGDIEGVVFVELGVDTLNDSSYNQLLKSLAFWDTFISDGIEKVLIFQLDAILVRSGIEEFLKWDYVGAPWTSTNDIYSGVNEAGVQIPSLPSSSRVGNGGLSLRNPSSMVDIIQRFASTSNHHEQEDVFFVRHLSKQGYAMADLKVGERFALEVPLSETTTIRRGHVSPSVLALHQAWWYTQSPTHRRDIARILDSAVKTLKESTRRHANTTVYPERRAAWFALLPGANKEEYRLSRQEARRRIREGSRRKKR